MKIALWVVMALVVLPGCAALEGDDYAVYDRNEGFNRASYRVTDSVDKAVLQPVARGYDKVTPGWFANGVLNIFENLTTIASSANGFLQGKPKSGATDFARILINSTIGLGGFFDVASRWNLPYQNEDFGQTLAVWGVTKSRYVFLPFLGPTTLRDLPSTVVRSYLPRLILGTEYNFGYGVLDVVSSRASLLTASEVRDASAIDPYAFTRDAYYQRRKFLIYDGHPPLDDFFDEFDEDE